MPVLPSPFLRVVFLVSDYCVCVCVCGGHKNISPTEVIDLWRLVCPSVFRMSFLCGAPKSAKILPR